MGTPHHRLARDRYQGRVSASFTLCIQDRRQPFCEPDVVRAFAELLKQVAEKALFNVVFCFMPDHVHLICLGIDDSSDLISGMERFKQVSGRWLAKNRKEFKWQKSF